jgi:hypothetical protein
MWLDQHRQHRVVGHVEDVQHGIVIAIIAIVVVVVVVVVGSLLSALAHQLMHRFLFDL